MNTMTTAQFMDNCKKLYDGKYNDYEYRLVTKRLNQIKDGYKRDMLAYLFDNFSKRFRIMPGLCEIKEAYEHVRKIKGELHHSSKATHYKLEDVPTAEELKEDQEKIARGELQSLSTQLGDKIKNRLNNNDADASGND